MCSSSAGAGYQARFQKSREKLFTFLDHDGVPWNNNNAEHALKRFADYRALVDGQMNETGLKAYLVLLSVCLSCKYKGVNFLKFLLSRQTDIDAFRRARGRAAPPPAVEVRPEGLPAWRRKRSPDWDQKKRPTYD